MSDNAAKMRDDFRDFLIRIAGAFSRFPELRSQSEELGRLAASIYQPFTLAVFGYMKTGKSSLINTLVGKPLAITGTDETTATLNWIAHGTQEQEKSFIVNWRDGTNEPFPLERLRDWTGKTQEALDRFARTAWIQLYADTAQLRNVRIVDTPGTGSVASEHSKAASEILSEQEGRKADALLYVFPAVAKALDAEALEEFRSSRLPGSDPYNSLGVLHKWDGLETDDPHAEARRKAKDLHVHLSDFVANVIPVSAPLGLAARHAPDAFFNNLLELADNKDYHDALRKALKRDNRWDADERRRDIRLSYPHIPWVSFVRIAHLLLDRSCNNSDEARTLCMEASGIPILESELDRRFFKSTAVIKQRLARARAEPLINQGILLLNKRNDELAADLKHFQQLLTLAGSNSNHAYWLQNKIGALAKTIQEHRELSIETDRYQLIEKERMNLLEMDMSLLDEIRKNPKLVEPEQADYIKAILGDPNSATKPNELSREFLLNIIANHQYHIQSPIRRNRELFAHLMDRIQNLIK